MPQETKVQPGNAADPAERTNAVAGQSFNLAACDAASAFEILEKAFDFRGDVTLNVKPARTVSGYLFDRRRGQSLADSSVRLMTPEGDKVAVAYADIEAIAFSDRDPAAGKSFETWVKKYIEKKLAGERASIESESLD